MDYAEEQEMEIEALESIFDEDLTVSCRGPYKFSVELVPNPGEGDDENHVSIMMNAELPEKYPEEAPIIVLEPKKGWLKTKHMDLLMEIVNNTIEEGMGEVMIFTVTEALKDWLIENNKKETTLYEQMIEEREEKAAVAQAVINKEQAKKDKIAEAEKSAYANPLGIDPSMLVTKETFVMWLKMFEEEQKALTEQIEVEDKPTGKQIFQMNLAKELGDDEKKEDGEDVFWFNESIYDDDDPELDDDSDEENQEPEPEPEPAPTPAPTPTPTPTPTPAPAPAPGEASAQSKKNKKKKNKKK